MSENMSNNTTPVRALHLDLARYQAMLDAPDLDEEQKRQFIEALWQVIVAFVDLGYQVHPVQQACGQVEKTGRQNPVAAPDVLNSSHHPTTDFAAASKAERDGRT